jgi:hypothetical protein
MNRQFDKALAKHYDEAFAPPMIPFERQVPINALTGQVKY